MTIAKVRDLSSSGVITDVDPYNLPVSAFSMAVNARFKGKSIYRAPVFRRFPLTLSQTDPRFLTSQITVAGFDTVYLGYLNGRVSKISSGTETDYSIFGYVNATADTPFTATILQNVLYINRSDRVPWKLSSTDSQFVTLAGGWDATWRANLLKNCGGALVALGVTKGAVSNPTMVKTSQIATINNIPASWDSTNPATNATENTLGDMQSPIIDAKRLGDNLMIYGYEETWVMQPDATQIFIYDKIFSDRGCLNANCVVEIDRQHYVFGPTDIWVHDGISKASICDLRTHDFIFSGINLKKAFRCFVHHDRLRKEIRFCYVSQDAYLGFVDGVDACNRCAVYSLIERTWTFDDLPFVYSATESNSDTTSTWNAQTGVWDLIGGSWGDQSDSIKRNTWMCGDTDAVAGTTRGLYILDTQGQGSNIAYSVDTHATLGVTLIKEGIDLDELPEVADNRGYKIVSSIYPQVRLEGGAQPLMFSFGSNDEFNLSPIYSTPQSFDPTTDIRCDFYSGGRYLSMKITHTDYHYFNITGLDIDLQVTGQV